MPIRAATVRVQRSNTGRGGEEEEKPERRGRKRELHQATGDCKHGPYSPPQPAQRRQQGLNLPSPPFRPFWFVLKTDGDRHCNTKGQPSPSAECPAHRAEGKFSRTGHLNH